MLGGQNLELERILPTSLLGHVNKITLTLHHLADSEIAYGEVPPRMSDSWLVGFGLLLQVSFVF